MDIKDPTVNHPQHYGGDTTYEAIKVIEAWQLDFALGNAVKYISRAGKKDSQKEIEDLTKALWYTQRRIEQLQKARGIVHAEPSPRPVALGLTMVVHGHGGAGNEAITNLPPTLQPREFNLMWVCASSAGTWVHINDDKNEAMNKFRPGVQGQIITVREVSNDSV